MTRHAETARALADWLDDQAGSPGSATRAWPSHPQHDVAARQFPHAAGCSPSSCRPAARAAGEAFINALTIPSGRHRSGSIHTIVAHPPTTTHRQFDDGALVEAGIGAGLLRCSVGLEDVDDLIADFDHALDAARAAARAGRPPRPGARASQRPSGALGDVIATVAADAGRRPGVARTRSPDRPGGLGPADLGQLRRRPDHRPARDGASSGWSSGSCRRSRSDRPADHATAMAQLHDRYDPLFGAGLVDALERAQVFQVFSSWWFSAGLVILLVSIVCCTLDRTPAAVAPVARHPGRPAGAVLRPAAARPGGDGRAAARQPSGPCSGATGSASARRDADGTATSTATAIVDEAGDPAHPHRARPVPGRGRRHEPARLRGGDRRRRGREPDGPADRHAGPARGQEHGFDAPGCVATAASRLHDRPGRVP